MKKYTIALICFYLLSACSPSQKEDTEQVPVYTVNIDEAQKIDFCSVFDSVTYLPLETVAENEIGQIDRILHQNGKYIIADRLTNTVFVYKDDGTYYSKIAAVGNGPGEYVQISDIAINKYDQIIKILDGMQEKIVSYDMDGRFIEEKKFPVSPTPQYFCQVDKDKYAYDFQRRLAEKEWQYNLSINSEDFIGKINKFLPYEKPLDICFSPRVTLQDTNDGIVYIPLYSSTIYTIDSLEVNPRYTLDFGDKWVDQEFINTEWKDALEFMTKLNNVNFVYYFNLLESGSHIYAEFMHKEKKYHLVIDKDTDHLFLQQDTDTYKSHFTALPMCCRGNEFIIPLTPSEYNSMAGEQAVQIPEENNPVLMFVTFNKF